MAKPVTYIDLDAVVPQNEVVVKLDGADHRLVPITLEDFVKNTKLVEKLNEGDKTDGEALELQVNTLIDMVGRAFPTIGADRLRRLNIPQLNQLLDVAKSNNGQETVEKEAAAEAAANPQTAG